MTPTRIGVKDLYRLRGAVLGAQRARLRAELAQQSLRDLILFLERRYGLLGMDAALDVHTGRITLSGSVNDGHTEVQAKVGEVGNGPGPDAH